MDSDREPCAICGAPSCIADGVVVAHLCESEACFHEAWDRAWGR